MPKDVPLAVEVPALGGDKPGWVKVGVIAAVGFVVGIAWPRIVGVRIGPSAPGEAASAAASAHAGRAPDAPPASVVAAKPTTAPTTSVPPPGPPATPTSATPASANAAPPNITVQKGLVISCKTADGETKKGAKECGPIPGVDALVTPRVRKIATCSGVEGQTGKLSLVVNADFASGRFWYDVGKSSTVQNLDAVTSCLKTAFHGTSTTATPHEHSRYTVAYTATFTPGNEKAGDAEDRAAHKGDKDKGDKESRSEKAKESHDKEPSKKEEADSPPAKASESSSGEAQVAWEVALVRDVPKTGGLVSRLPRGTKVKVGSMKDGWYQIKFGDNFASEGWVYRGAIGR